MTNVERRDVGGKYFHPHIEGKVITSVLLRDCEGQLQHSWWKDDEYRKGDYEVMSHVKGKLIVFPIWGEWNDNDLVKELIELDGKDKTSNKQ